MKAEKEARLLSTQGARPSLCLAPGVVFDEAAHTYHLKGKRLSGVTGVIGNHLGTKFPDGFVGEARDEGLHVHHAVEAWVNSGCMNVNSIHPGVQWLTTTLLDVAKNPSAIFSEVLVSDGHTYASSVDIITVDSNDVLDLWDMKRTFKRVSVTWQLSIYRYLIETTTRYKVGKLWCAAFRDLEYYPIFPKSFSEVENLLYKQGVK